MRRSLVSPLKPSEPRGPADKRHGVSFTPEAHWNVAMMLRRLAMAAPDDAKRQELERLARIALLCGKLAAQQQRKNT